MLNKIIKFALHNRIGILIGAVLLMIVGGYVTSNMEVDVFPDLNAPTVVVMTEAQGLAAEETERLVTFQIETAVNGATNVRRVRSSSTTGFSVVWVEFEWGTDIYKARQIVSEKLSGLTEILPQGVGKPTLGPQSSIMGEIMIIGLTADSTDQKELRTLADWIIRPALMSTEGVAQVAVIGGDVKEYQILLHPQKMEFYNVSLDEVNNAVTGITENRSGNIHYEYGNEYIVRTILSTHKTDEIKNSFIKMNENGVPVLLQDIASLEIGAQSPKLGIASSEGQAAALITVSKQPNTNTLELTKTLDRKLESLAQTFPSDVHINNQLFRQSKFIESSINNIKDALIEGGIFVVIILLLFLMNIRTSIISLVTIPLSLVVSILTLKLMGITINTMTLGGLAIAIGSLVDDAIVDVENVYERLRKNRKLPIEERRPTLDVVFDASKEVRIPILNSTLIVIASFIPLFFLSGMEGRMLQPLGIAFITALGASTVVALTLTPVLCSFLLDSEKEKNRNETWLTRHIKKAYLIVLDWALSHKKIVLGSTFALFAFAFILFLSFGRSFLPSFNEGSLTINIGTIPGISLEESDKIGHAAEEILLEIPEIQTVGRKTGRAELDEHALGVNMSEIEAPFQLKDRSKEEMLAEIRSKLNQLPGVNVEIGQPISHRIDAMLSGTKANIAIKIFGDDLNRLFKTGKKIKSEIAEIEGITDLNVEQQIERPQLQIIPKREMLNLYGISIPEFGEKTSILLGGKTVSQIYEGEKTFNLVMKVDEENRQRINDIKQILFDTEKGKVPLGSLAEIRSTTGPNTINRENASRKVVVSANVSNRDLRSAVNEIQQKINQEIELPEGYHIEYGGQFESEEKASSILLVTSLLSIMIIFLLLYNEFRNGVQSLVIMLNLPLALIGGIFSISITGSIISIPSIIGFISLFGIATRNGILLINRYNALKEEGLTIRECIIQGSTDRLNPILMTALTSALALIPLAFNGDLPGNEIQSPMSKVILGGLLSSTLLNGIIIPCMYYLINKKK